MILVRQAIIDTAGSTDNVVSGEVRAQKNDNTVDSRLHGNDICLCQSLQNDSTDNDLKMGF